MLTAFAVAFAVDMATGQRYSAVWGSAAIVTGLLAVLPAARGYALPVAAYAGTWAGFLALRAVADDSPWRPFGPRAVADLEARLTGGTLPGEALQRLHGTAAYPPVALLATAVYLSYFVIPHVAAAWLLAKDRARFWRGLAASGVLFAIGCAAFALLPSNPPWLADPDLRRVVQELLPVAGGDAQGRYAFDPNPVASMPSIHLGVTALLVGLARAGRWRRAALAYALAMGFALVFTGEHYVLDVAAGGLAAWAAWRLSGALPGIRNRAGS